MVECVRVCAQVHASVYARGGGGVPRLAATRSPQSLRLSLSVPRALMRGGRVRAALLRREVT